MWEGWIHFNIWWILLYKKKFNYAKKYFTKHPKELLHLCIALKERGHLRLNMSKK